MGSIKPQGKERQVSESSIDLTTHNQILKQQKQLNGRNHYIPIDMNNEHQWTQLPLQKTPFDKLN
jgi:hypothetical protein